MSREVSDHGGRTGVASANETHPLQQRCRGLLGLLQLLLVLTAIGRDGGLVGGPARGGVDGVGTSCAVLACHGEFLSLGEGFLHLAERDMVKGTCR